MNGKLRRKVADLEAEVRRLARAAESHPAQLQAVHDEVKSARADLAGVAEAVRSELKGLTQSVQGVFAQASEAVAAPAAPPKRNGKAGSPTTAAKAASEENS